MSLGANLSSGYTDKLRDATVQCSISGLLSNTVSSAFLADPGNRSKIYPMAAYPSMMRLQPPQITRAHYALYPKAAVPSSVLTESLVNRSVATRFSQYIRYQPPLPCLPLPQSANMAGISLPSSRPCNLYSGVQQT